MGFRISDIASWRDDHLSKVFAGNPIIATRQFFFKRRADCGPYGLIRATFC
jgi:hypothetical protein